MMKDKNKKHIEWCLRKAEQEGFKHKGLKIVKIDLLKVQHHLVKAKRNLKLAQHLIEYEYKDWAVSAFFYALYHCLLAILWKHGYESRNQSCTFAVIEYLILENKVGITIEELHYIQESNNEDDETIINLREYYQYGTETQIDNQKITLIQQHAKGFVTKVNILLEETE